MTSLLCISSATEAICCHILLHAGVDTATMVVMSLVRTGSMASLPWPLGRECYSLCIRGSWTETEEITSTRKVLMGIAKAATPPSWKILSLTSTLNGTMPRPLYSTILCALSLISGDAPSELDGPLAMLMSCGALLKHL